MKVTLVTRIFRPEPSAATFRLGALADALHVQGHDVEVLTAAAPRRLRATPESVRVRRWPVLRDRSGYVRGYVQYLSFDLPALVRTLLTRRPDVVVSEPPPTTGAAVRLACALRRVPYVYYAADIWSDASASTGAPGVVVRALRAVERWALGGAAHVIAVSPDVAERARALGARRVTVVRNGIDTTVFHPEGNVADGVPPGPYAVYAGTTSEWQGADVFVRAMAKVAPSVRDAKLVFLGNGSAWDDIARTAADLPDGGACVRMVGQVPADVAAGWLRGAQAGLVSLRPGQGYDFAFPTKVFAAVGSGTPVLYAGPGPARPVIEGAGLGRVVDHDVDDVADALVAMLSRPIDQAGRHRLAAWADAHASIRSTGEQAAGVVVGVVG
ncbi:glycosyltransferase family 4 protein [Cellulosimicrobium cellulans]|uniref:glycosyltransferase family 4 protein n=1 Tax=Cellulosimicrobium cellulans TaxID=1710 RepID=UPI000ADA3C8D|nr:glycosyltransferase family 4 protein [Cellulosimicrobium cellulans]